MPNAIVHAKGWVDMVFVGPVPASTTTLVVDGAEVYEAAWSPVDDLPRLTARRPGCSATTAWARSPSGPTSTRAPA